MRCSWQSFTTVLNVIPLGTCSHFFSEMNWDISTCDKQYGEWCFGQRKLFIYICDSGGSVKLSVLLKQSSPLASRKSELEAKNWLMSQTYPCLVVVKDFNGEIAGVRIDLRKILSTISRERFLSKCSGKVFWEGSSGIFVKDSCKRTAMANATTRTTFWPGKQREDKRIWTG